MTNPSSISIPEKKTYLISESNKRLLSAVMSMSDDGSPVNILIKGKNGCGKSELVTQLAVAYNRPLAVLEIGLLAEASQIFGRIDLKEGKTVYTPGLFIRAIQTPGCIVHLQELNRAESDKSLNAIFSVLDENIRGIWIDELEEYIRVAPGVVFVSTLNEGFEFVGTMPLDAALEDRFPYKLTLGYLPIPTEMSLLQLRTGVNQEVALNLVSLFSRMRNNSQDPIHVSTRAGISIAFLIKAGLNLAEAIKSVVTSDESEIERLLLDLHLSGEETEGEGINNSHVLLS